VFSVLAALLDMCELLHTFCILSGMKEDDICELLKFERKMLRARISTLRSDKFIQVRLKMETGLDGKAQKVNYYFINYKVIKLLFH
jgi:transcription initiation factor IIE alpha subunit